VGKLHAGTGRSALAISASMLVMGSVTGVMAAWLPGHLPTGVAGDLGLLLGAGGSGLGVYLLCLRALGVNEVQEVVVALGRRLRAR
jgi:hypothetical protein